MPSRKQARLPVHVYNKPLPSSERRARQSGYNNDSDDHESMGEYTEVTITTLGITTVNDPDVKSSAVANETIERGGGSGYQDRKASASASAPSNHPRSRITKRTTGENLTHPFSSAPMDESLLLSPLVYYLKDQKNKKASSIQADEISTPAADHMIQELQHRVHHDEQQSTTLISHGETLSTSSSRRSFSAASSSSASASTSIESWIQHYRQERFRNEVRLRREDEVRLRREDNAVAAQRKSRNSMLLLPPSSPASSKTEKQDNTQRRRRMLLHHHHHPSHVKSQERLQQMSPHVNVRVRLPSAIGFHRPQPQVYAGKGQGGFEAAPIQRLDRTTLAVHLNRPRQTKYLEGACRPFIVPSSLTETSAPSPSPPRRVEENHHVDETSTIVSALTLDDNNYCFSGSSSSRTMTPSPFAKPSFPQRHAQQPHDMTTKTKINKNSKSFTVTTAAQETKIDSSGTRMMGTTGKRSHQADRIIHSTPAPAPAASKTFSPLLSSSTTYTDAWNPRRGGRGPSRVIPR